MRVFFKNLLNGYQTSLALRLSVLSGLVQAFAMGLILSELLSDELTLIIFLISLGIAILMALKCGSLKETFILSILATMPVQLFFLSLFLLIYVLEIAVGLKNGGALEKALSLPTYLKMSVPIFKFFGLPVILAALLTQFSKTIFHRITKLISA